MDRNYVEWLKWHIITYCRREYPLRIRNKLAERLSKKYGVPIVVEKEK